MTPGTTEHLLDAARSFPPLEGERATVLILGSMPGVASLRAARYYAHPRNAFWPIVIALLDGESPAASTTPGTGRASGAGAASRPGRRGVAERLPPYERKAARLVAADIALWDVLAECERPGSLDASIRRGSERANDLPSLVARHPELALVAFNGQTAAKLFERHVGEAVRASRPDLALATLPSTSPAYASLTLADKYARWHAALAPHLSS